MKILIVVGIIINMLASCVPNTPVTPPNAALPGTYRGVDAPTSDLADLPWQQLYTDPVLQKLIATALEHNLSVASAYQVILQAQANVDINAGKQQPQVNGELKAPFNQSQGQTPLTVIVGNNGTAAHSTFQPELGLGISYEIDLFGRLASATAAARAQLLESVEGRNAVIWQLIANVATNYFTLREQDDELDIARRTLIARKLNLDLVKARYIGGVSDLQAVRQAEESYYEVSTSIPAFQREIALTENTLSILIGAYPEDIPRGLPLEQQVTMPALPPAGIPSALLTRRPDIMQAEANLAAASANLDVARKLLYPQLTFSVVAGAGYTAINSAFYGPEGLLSLVPELVTPIFNGGSLKANVRLNQAERQQVAVSYLQSVESAMQEVANAVVSYNRLREVSTQTDLQTAAAVDSTRLAVLRYQGGVTSYLEVLDSETRSYQDELTSVQAHLNERLALVQLYLALGGGWQQAGS